ncbi:MAG: glycosyltransferase family 2 protein [Candidatus Freyarchaeota archaeon]|nr:glycosyltransferase family 2 protein [Candidatus Jordarchaeia archaeon]MBS7270061.1 glycosyltransferase family 2 protein [Candidatus Jordarchaeia archaeon]MBS7278341.1 glycosyltransferase family 2 protein [Candidatus Jordarchaeia archaeon]
MADIPQKVDVVIPVKTKESLRKEFIDRIYEEIPVNRLIIIEGGALSEARKKAYDQVSTDWLVFLDDDVLVGKGWWKTMTNYIDDETGAIGGMISQVHPQLGPYTETVWMLRDPSKLGNPGINNCLMRKEALKGYNPPKIFWGEDQILYQYVTKKWKWKKVKVNGFHYIKLHDMIQLGYVYNKLKLYPKRWILRRFLQIPIVSFLVGLRSHSPKTAFWLANHYLEFLVGWVKGLFY